MAKSKNLSNQAKKIIKDTKFREARSEVDTVRIWENYREQALLWRAISLLQMFVTLAAIVIALVMYFEKDITLKVPPKPLPGYYSPYEVHDSQYTNVATEFVNLIGSYQYKNAERQFEEAAKYLAEPMLTKYQKEMLGTELNIIMQSQRSQIYFIDQTRTEIDRTDPDHVKVSLVGERIKAIAGELMKPQITKFTITMTTIPRNAFNEFGIVIESAELSKLKF